MDSDVNPKKYLQSNSRRKKNQADVPPPLTLIISSSRHSINRKKAIPKYDIYFFVSLDTCQQFTAKAGFHG
jgi:hypothetical protein